MKAVFWLLCLLMLVLFIFALLGMELFGGQFRPPAFIGERPRSHFDTISNAMLTSFVVATSEDWNTVYHDVARANGSPTPA